ncbi:hypothetical protein COV81_04525, partial [Candidatus Peregrinibacteria bacterium CG11_big_fil_rev_8_21_14_0_20_41_10]
PRKLYNTYKNEPIDPLNHPCYWGDLEPGETVRIPLNKYGWSLSEITNLKLRLRTKCLDGSDWCKDRGRETYDDINLDGHARIDDSPTVATWVLEVNEGEVNYGSSKGDVSQVDCHGFSICRYLSNIVHKNHSEITKYLLKGGQYHSIMGEPYMDIFKLGSDQGLRMVDLSTNDYVTLGLSTVFTYLQNIYANSPNIIFQINNATRSDNNGQTLEYQIISNKKIPKR